MTLGDITRRGLAVAATAALAALVAAAPPKPAAANQDTMVIAIGALPQGIDLDKHVSPQTWSMGAQVFEDGMNWEWVDFPYPTGEDWDPSTIPGFKYPDYTGQRILVPGIIEKCELEPEGKRAVYHLRKGVISPWGNEFTADDVLWRIRRGKATGAINNFLEFLLNMPGQTINPPNQGGYRKIDDYTVEVLSSAGMPLACKGLTNYYNAWLDSTEIMKHATEEDPWGDKWVATNGGGFGGYGSDRVDRRQAGRHGGQRELLARRAGDQAHHLPGGAGIGQPRGAAQAGQGAHGGRPVAGRDRVACRRSGGPRSRRARQPVHVDDDQQHPAAV